MSQKKIKFTYIDELEMIFPYKYQQANSKETGYVLRSSESVAGFFVRTDISSLKTDGSKELGGIELKRLCQQVLNYTLSPEQDFPAVREASIFKRLRDRGVLYCGNFGPLYGCVLSVCSRKKIGDCVHNMCLE